MPDYVITADSVPDYDDWGIDTYWGCKEWITWHKEMKKVYGKDYADQTWVKAWQAGDGFFDVRVPLDCRTFNQDFRQYIQQEGLYDYVYNGVGIIAKPLGTGADIASSAANAATSTAKFAENFIKYGLPITVSIIIILIIIYIITIVRKGDKAIKNKS